MSFPSMLRGPRALVVEARAGLSGDEPTRARTSVTLYACLVLLALGLAWAAGLAVYRVQSARFATLFSVAVAILAVLGSAPLVPEILRLLRKGAAPAPATEATAEAAPGQDFVPSVRARIVCAVLFAAIEDGLVATSTTIRAQTAVLPSLGAGLVAAGLLLLPLAVLTAPLAFVLSRPGAAGLARHLRVGIGGDEPGGAPIGLALYAGFVGVSAYASWQIGVRVSETQAAAVAVLVSSACAVALTLTGAVVAASLSRVLAWMVRPLARLQPPDWLPLEEMAMATLGVIALYAILPQTQAITPSAGVVGFAIGPHLASRLPSLGSLARAPVVVLAVASLVITLGLTFGFDRLPDLVRTGVIGRAPYAALYIGAVHRPADSDQNHEYATIPFKPPVQTPARDPNAPPLRENVILIHIEALRPDHVGFIGYKRPTTPHIDRFRETATWFKNAYSPAPTTRFALSMLFTGHEIERIPQSRGHAVDFTLLPGAETLAERLTPTGYDTVGYTLTYVIQHIHDLGQGFRVWETPWQINDWERAYQDSAKQTTDAALKYLSGVPADGSKPYLLFLHYMSNHDPYIKHAAWDYGSEQSDLYDSALNYEDDQLGRLFDALEARGDKDKTAIFLYSDHGELFGEHGYHRHGFTLYQPDIHVVLLAHVPGTNVHTIDTPMLLTDLTPTVEELTGLPADPDTQTWDLMPYLRGAPMPTRRLFLYSDQWRGGVHYVSRGVIEPDGHTKLIHNRSVRTQELYDIATDPDELHNLATSRPDDVARMSGMIDGWDDYQNKEHRSFETTNHEVKEKQANVPLPVFK